MQGHWALQELKHLQDIPSTCPHHHVCLLPSVTTICKISLYKNAFKKKKLTSSGWYISKNSSKQRQISGQKMTASFACLVIPSEDMWGSLYFLSHLQNYCPTSSPARYKARQFLRTCAVPLIMYKRTDSCAKPGDTKGALPAWKGTKRKSQQCHC